MNFGLSLWILSILIHFNFVLPGFFPFQPSFFSFSSGKGHHVAPSAHANAEVEHPSDSTLKASSSTSKGKKKLNINVSPDF